MTNPLETVKKIITYMGQREATGGKLAHAWLVEGEEAWYSKPAGGVVGGLYSIEMTPDLKSMFSNSLAYTMERIDDKEQIALWEIKHQTVVRKRKRAAAERKHKANTVLKDATWSIDRIIEKMKTPDEAYALITLVSDHIMDEYWRSRK